MPLHARRKVRTKFFYIQKKRKVAIILLKIGFLRREVKNYLGISEVYFNSNGYRNGKRWLKGEEEAPTSGFKELGFRQRRRRGEKSDEER